MASLRPQTDLEPTLTWLELGEEGLRAHSRLLSSMTQVSWAKHEQLLKRHT